GDICRNLQHLCTGVAQGRHGFLCCGSHSSCASHEHQIACTFGDQPLCYLQPEAAKPTREEIGAVRADWKRSNLRMALPFACRTPNQTIDEPLVATQCDLLLFRPTFHELCR